MIVRPTIDEIRRDKLFRLLNQTATSKSTVQEVYNELKKSNFAWKRLLTVDYLHGLERHFWPTFQANAAARHAMLIVLMVNVKRRENLEVWSTFQGDLERFSLLFDKVMQMSLSRRTSLTERSHLILFMTSAFGSLDRAMIRTECAPLVSIATWNNLSSPGKRDKQISRYPQLEKAWRSSIKRFHAADETVKQRMTFQQNWLYNLLREFIHLLYQRQLDTGGLYYCERMIELLIDIESQLPTRRYINFLMQDLHLLVAIRLSPHYTTSEARRIRDQTQLLAYYMSFPLNEYTGLSLTSTEQYEMRAVDLRELQKIAFEHFKEKLQLLAISNLGALGMRENLLAYISDLSDSEFVQLCSLVQMRIKYGREIEIEIDRRFLTEAFLEAFEQPQTIREQIEALDPVPTEKSLLDEILVKSDSYDGTRPLPIPKLNLQYLSVEDFLWRSFVLYRYESFYEIHTSLLACLEKLNPILVYPTMETNFKGASRMALQISKPIVLEVAPPKVGHTEPAFVRTEILLELDQCNDGIRSEWESLRAGEIIFLLHVRGTENSSMQKPVKALSDFGLVSVRSCEVVELLDIEGRKLNVVEQRAQFDEIEKLRMGKNRRLHVHMDAKLYATDIIKAQKDHTEPYCEMNVIFRRRQRENNFKSILDSLKGMMNHSMPLPTWLQDVFLGYGDPSSAVPEPSITQIDYNDTFLDLDHLKESFSHDSLSIDDKSLCPPFVLQTTTESEPYFKPTKLRKRADSFGKTPKIIVQSYRKESNGPYTAALSQKNKIRYTPAQIDAILKGTNLGLTIVLGPPGTGKTDVAVQIMSNIYHNFPQEKTLLIAHSNQALNQLFEKIAALDIDERFLLRLGHGEEALRTQYSFSKYGRIESFLDRRSVLLADVDRLAQCLGAPGAHGDSCETAAYFRTTYVIPAWELFLSKAESMATKDLVDAFPFHDFFSDAPQPVFPVDASLEELLYIAKGCNRYINGIFDTLADIRPFEILRNNKDKADYLLIKEAKIIALTSTYAATQRKEIMRLGFTFDNILVEEAAQILEAESLLPFGLQKYDRLKRIVLIGDHLQNSPVVKHMAFRQYANMEQSLFLRLVRLGVPYVLLNAQGRARPSIANLYSWRYKELNDLPHTHQEEYAIANTGLRYEFQFIDVGLYQGQGETQPRDHFTQNLGEAEYAVALYQYLRLQGYAAKQITILTTYAGQKALLRDVLESRCARNPLFGLPGALATVDQYQGEQNDIVLLSLVRTQRVGYLRDPRRITVALSRARLGLYVFGCKWLFESCIELQEPMQRLLHNPDALSIVPDEQFPTSRRCTDEVQSIVMENVEKFGEYVYEMTQQKLKELNIY